MLNFFLMLRHPYINGLFMPFKIFDKTFIKISSTAKINFDSRLTLGNKKKMAVVSHLPINLYFGNYSKIQIGSSVSIGPGVNIIVKKNATLNIGKNTYFTSDMHIEVVNNLQIGMNCAISWGVTILDDDHHTLLPQKINDEKSTIVKIGNHVWIGCNSTILKGTKIGNNCIVAAGSIVTGVFPDNVLIAGNPARIVKQEINWQ